VEHGDELMMVSDQGQIIRAPVEDIRIAGRNTRGVILFRTAEDEHVVSVERLAEAEGGDEGDDGAE
jgi:DNA gyrase subunit A